MRFSWFLSYSASHALLWFLFIHNTVQGAAKHNDYQYMVTIDAGSSGSRLHVHKISMDQPLPQILSAVNHKVKPGLSFFEDTPDTVDEQHIQGLLEFAYEQVPAGAWKETPLYLKATAGMRSIPKDKADAIMAVVRASLSGTAFLFQEEWATVISGSDEAKYSWIAANYLNGRFNNSGDGNEMLGVIEMGGASMQISYPVPTTVEVDGDTILEVNLGAQTYHLFAHSFLGYGLEKAQELLAQQTPDKIATCYPQGNTYNNNIEGAGVYEQCYEAMDSILKISSCNSHIRLQKGEPPERCSIQGTLLPHWDAEKTQFLALENFYYTASFLTENDNHFYNLPSRGQTYCASNYDDLKHRYAQQEDFQLQRHCFGAAYIAALLDHGFGIPMTDHTTVAHTVGDTDIDWAVGSVVHDALEMQYTHNLPPPKEEKSDDSSSTGNPAILLLGAVGLVILIVARRRQKKFRQLQQ